MADTIAVMNDGRIEQMGEPDRRSTRTPSTTFVANFLGQSNLVAGDGHRHARATTSLLDVAGSAGSAMPRRAAATTTSDASGSACGRRRSAITSDGRRAPDGPTASTGDGHRRLLHRRLHPVPRAHAVGPGAHRRPAERRVGDPAGRATAGAPHLGARSTPSPSTRRRTRTPARTVDAEDGGRWQRRDARERARARACARRRATDRRAPSQTQLDAVPPAAARACCGWSIFFVVPMLSLLSHVAADRARSSRATRSPGTSADLHRRALAATSTQFIRSFVYAGIATVLGAADRLSARLHDRVQVRAVEEPPAGAGDRAVLHQLPDPHAGLADDPVRRRPGRRSSVARPHIIDAAAGAAASTTGDQLLTTPFAVISA